MPVNGVVSTRRGNAGPWLGLLGRRPVGRWALSLADRDDVREWIDGEGALGSHGCHLLSRSHACVACLRKIKWVNMVKGEAARGQVISQPRGARHDAGKRFTADICRVRGYDGRDNPVSRRRTHTDAGAVQQHTSAHDGLFDLGWPLGVPWVRNCQKSRDIIIHEDDLDTLGLYESKDLV